MHYVCTGTCGGRADEPGVCAAEECTRHGEPLAECDCTDEQHELPSDDSEESGE